MLRGAWLIAGLLLGVMTGLFTTDDANQRETTTTIVAAPGHDPRRATKTEPPATSAPEQETRLQHRVQAAAQRAVSEGAAAVGDARLRTGRRNGFR